MCIKCVHMYTHVHTMYVKGRNGTVNGILTVFRAMWIISR